MNSRRWSALNVMTVLAVAAGFAPAAAGAANAAQRPERLATAPGLAGVPDHDRVAAPLTFIENRGRVDPRAAFYVPGSERSILLAEDGIWVTGRQGQAEQTTAALGLAAEADWATRLGPPRAAETPHVMPTLRLEISFPGANPHPRLEPME